MATYDGANIFGECVVRTEILPPAVQQNAYPGVNGIEEIRLGTRGAITVVEGWLVGATTGDLSAAETAIRSKQEQAVAKTFVDNYGNTWPNVRVLDFKPDGRVMTCAGASLPSGGYCRRYVATLLHLT